MFFLQSATVTFPISDIPSPAIVGDLPKVTRVGTFLMSSASSGREKFLRLWFQLRADLPPVDQGRGGEPSAMWPSDGRAQGGCEDPGSTSWRLRRCWHTTSQKESMGDSPAAARQHRLAQPGEGGIEGQRRRKTLQTLANQVVFVFFSACAIVAQCAPLSPRSRKTVIGSCKMARRCWATPKCDIKKRLLANWEEIFC